MTQTIDQYPPKGISVQRHQGVGGCKGGQVIGQIAHFCEWPAAVVSISVNGVGIWMSRDEAAEVAENIRGCLLDG